MRQLAKSCDLVRAVDGPGFSSLSDGDCRRNHLVRAVSKFVRYGALQRFGRDLPISAGKFDQLEAPAKELWRSALICGYVGVGVTQHSAPWRRNVGKRQSVRCRSCRQQKYCHFALEKLRYATLNGSSPIIIAVGGRKSFVRLHDCIEDSWCNGCRVVT